MENFCGKGKLEKKLYCIVIHGCPSNVEKAMSPETRTYDKHWIPWIKKELITRGRGHYTMGDMGTEEFSELLKVVLR